jgi:hypothetical protein
MLPALACHVVLSSTLFVFACGVFTQRIEALVPPQFKTQLMTSSVITESVTWL